MVKLLNIASSYYSNNNPGFRRRLQTNRTIYHKCTPAFPKPTPAKTLARCISDLASKSSGFSTALKQEMN